MINTRRLCARRHSRFTLMELMIVLLILGLLAALVTPNLMSKAEKAKVKSAELQIRMLSNALKDYYLDMDEYPEELADLVEDHGGAKWDGPYLDPPVVPTDPWGNPYRYDCPGQHAKFDICSYGADGAPGGDKYDADITSWQ
jgi:general secretion pathway protein G